MSVQISVKQLNGEVLLLEVMPEMTGREIKEQIKQQQQWRDEFTRQTTRVELVIGQSRLLENNETAAAAGLSPESEVTVVFKENSVRCSHQNELARLGREIDLESLFVVEILSEPEIVAKAFGCCCNLAGVTMNSVTRIGEGAFGKCSSLTRVTMPDSLIRIGDEAFKNCSSLTSVTIPNSVTLIGAGAFRACSSLTSVTIPNSVTNIEFGAFASCSSLASVTIPNAVTHIGEGAFGNCSSLASVTIPSSVTYIGEGAFGNCSSLTSVSIPQSVPRIGHGAFRNCSSLVTVTMSNSVTHIGHGAFKDCSSLESLTIPDSVIQIEACAFENCSSLASLTIPNSVTHIGFGAFMNCRSLDSLSIPDVVTNIGSSAFKDCNRLTLSISVRMEGFKGAGVDAFKCCKQILAKECECHACKYSWFLDGWRCPRQTAPSTAPQKKPSTPRLALEERPRKPHKNGLARLVLQRGGELEESTRPMTTHTHTTPWE